MHIKISIVSRRVRLIVLSLLLSAFSFAQDQELVLKRVFDYVNSYPQEKVYAFTDKGRYVSGETIWYRLFLTDAAMHWEMADWSRYIYVDMVNPNGDVISHDKIVQDEYGIFHNSVDLADDLPEGYYLLRAYSSYMLGTPDYLFEKRLFVSDPQSSVLRVEPVFDSGTVRFIFYAGDRVTSEVTTFTTISCLGDRKEYSSVESVILSSYGSLKNLYIEFVYRNRRYRKYISLSNSIPDYDVSFFAEGGNLIDGIDNRIGIKVLKSNGLSCELRGKIYDDLDNELCDIATIHAGMGSFVFTPERGRSYYAVCTDGLSDPRRFDLPAISPRGYSLQAYWEEDELCVSAIRSSGASDITARLFAHVRGTPVYYGDIEVFSAATMKSGRDEVVLRLNKIDIPSGVIHLLLLDEQMTPLSERLCFSLNEADIPKARLSSDKSSYLRRDLVKILVDVSDIDGYRLDGRIAVSVTDDKDVEPDSTVTILSSLLLSSDLRGYIESPEYYLSGNQKSQAALDALLLTQGWRRYDISSVLTGSVKVPEGLMELGQFVSGKVVDKDTGRPLSGVEVSILALSEGVADTMVSDSLGRFYFGGFELSAGSMIVRIYDPKNEHLHAKLMVDSQETPQAKAISYTYNDYLPGANYEDYIIKSDRKFTEENGMRVIEIESVTVTAQRRELRRVFATPFNRVISEQKIKEAKGNVYSIITDIPDVAFDQGFVYILNSSYNRAGRLTLPARIVLDGIIMHLDFDVEKELRGADVVALEVIPNGASMMIDPGSTEEISDIVYEKTGSRPVFSRFGDSRSTSEKYGAGEQMGLRGQSGAIIITTRAGSGYVPPGNPDKYANISLKGYKPYVEFFSPKYEPQRETTDQKADLRTTIYWNPDIVVKDGKAQLEFYASDSESTYSVTVEGISSEGGLIRFSESLISVKR